MLHHCAIERLLFTLLSLFETKIGRNTCDANPVSGTGRLSPAQWLQAARCAARSSPNTVAPGGSRYSQSAKYGDFGSGLLRNTLNPLTVAASVGCLVGCLVVRIIHYSRAAENAASAEREDILDWLKVENELGNWAFL